jgi:hypothetical protein
MTPISPKTIAKPKAAINNTEPMLMPLNRPSNNADTKFYSLPGLRRLNKLPVGLLPKLSPLYYKRGVRGNLNQLIF